MRYPSRSSSLSTESDFESTAVVVYTTTSCLFANSLEIERTNVTGPPNGSEKTGITWSIFIGAPLAFDAPYVQAIWNEGYSLVAFDYSFHTVFSAGFQ